jgi:hypothetical protein
VRSRDHNLKRAKTPSRRSFQVPGDSDDPRQTARLAILYAELARAQAEGDTVVIDYARDTIREFLTATPENCADLPLLPILRKLKRKRRR